MKTNPAILRSVTLFTLAGLAGCALGAQQNAYYGDRWDPPTISGIAQTSEVGTVGGATTTISGSGFGDDASKVVVQIGQHSAQILEISDSSITVVIPPGPMTGGVVDIDVATPTGFASMKEGYTYDTQGAYDEQSAYVQVNNYWESCLGGLSTRSDDEHGNLGCSTIAYMGYTGLTGTAEGYDFLYPRVHTPNSGFMSATDAGTETWQVERPGSISYPFGVQDLHQDLGAVTLHNPFFDGAKEYCADLDSTATYRYGGGEEGYPNAYTVQASSIPDGARRDACQDGERGYALNTLNFCASTDADGIPTQVYEADWPVNENFFTGNKNNLVPVDVTLDVANANLAGVPITLPEPIVVYTTQGITPPTDTSDAQTDLWSIGSFDSCFADTQGNGERLDDVALEFTWAYSKADLSTNSADSSGNGEIVDARTYVRVTITELALNWFGVSSYPVRAVIEVPDKYNKDADGFSHLEVPASVMYQLPTVLLPAAGGLGDGLLDSKVTNWGYVVVDFQRVTDYTISSSLKGDVVFSYTTGDFGFFDWTNPTESDACHNCLDDDNDGWADDADPDCANGSTESGRGDTACNDGIDNDGDGRIDSADTACDDAYDDDESNCDDGVDNDRDGYEDAEDPDCAAGHNETVDDSVTSCTDGTDDDGDGWVDAADPDCASGDAELGFGTTACNDGEDNDGDLRTDQADPECVDALDDDEGA